MRKMKFMLVTAAIGLSSVSTQAQVIEANGKLAVKLSYFKRSGCNAKCVAVAVLAAAAAGGMVHVVESESSDTPEKAGQRSMITAGVVGSAFVLSEVGQGLMDGTEDQKTDTKSTNAHVSMAPWGEGKARVNLALDGKNRCGSVQQSFLAVEMASGSYELYTQNSQEEPVLVGELFKSEKNVQINFVRELRAKTTGFRGTDCWWSIAPNTSISLKR
jgi:hypothetical protein